MAHDERYTIISADCHGGGSFADYRPYLPSTYHDEYDAWVASYDMVFEDLLGDLGERNWNERLEPRRAESRSLR